MTSPQAEKIAERLTRRQRAVVLTEGAEWQEREQPLEGFARLTRVDNVLIDAGLLEFDVAPDWISNVTTGSRAVGQERLRTRLTPLGLEVQSALREAASKARAKGVE